MFVVPPSSASEGVLPTSIRKVPLRWGIRPSGETVGWFQAKHRNEIRFSMDLCASRDPNRRMVNLISGFLMNTKKMQLQPLSLPFASSIP